MTLSINLDNLNIEEKLRLMEMLWEDLTKNGDILSPNWHEEVLKNREKRLQEGLEEVIHWKEAKENITKLIVDAN